MLRCVDCTKYLECIAEKQNEALKEWMGMISQKQMLESVVNNMTPCDKFDSKFKS